MRVSLSTNLQCPSAIQPLQPSFMRGGLVLSPMPFGSSVPFGYSATATALSNCRSTFGFRRWNYAEGFIKPFVSPLQRRVLFSHSPKPLVVSSAFRQFSHFDGYFLTGSYGGCKAPTCRSAFRPLGTSLVLSKSN